MTGKLEKFLKEQNIRTWQDFFAKYGELKEFIRIIQQFDPYEVTLRDADSYKATWITEFIVKNDMYQHFLALHAIRGVNVELFNLYLRKYSAINCLKVAIELKIIDDPYLLLAPHYPEELLAKAALILKENQKLHDHPVMFNLIIFDKAEIVRAYFDDGLLNVVIYNLPLIVFCYKIATDEIYLRKLYHNFDESKIPKNVNPKRIMTMLLDEYKKKNIKFVHWKIGNLEFTFPLNKVAEHLGLSDPFWRAHKRPFIFV